MMFLMAVIGLFAGLNICASRVRPDRVSGKNAYWNVRYEVHGFVTEDEDLACYDFELYVNIDETWKSNGDVTLGSGSNSGYYHTMYYYWRNCGYVGGRIRWDKAAADQVAQPRMDTVQIKYDGDNNKQYTLKNEVNIPLGGAMGYDADGPYWDVKYSSKYIDFGHGKNFDDTAKVLRIVEYDTVFDCVLIQYVVLDKVKAYKNIEPYI